MYQGTSSIDTWLFDAVVDNVTSLGKYLLAPFTLYRPIHATQFYTLFQNTLKYCCLNEASTLFEVIHLMYAFYKMCK